MLVVKVLKKLFASLKHPTGRFNYVQGFLRNIPGEVGMTLRNEILPRYFASCGRGVFIQEGVRFLNVYKIQIGNNVGIGNGSFLQGAGKIEIGNDVLLGPDVKIWSTNHKFDKIDKPILEQGWEYKKVTIMDGCWLGANVLVLPGVTLSEGCVVSAGSVVNVKKYPPYSIIAGNPARVIGNRQARS